MELIQLNNRQRNEIIKMTKPSKRDYFSYQNMNLLSAVYDEEKHIYLTMTGYMSSAITRMDSPYNEYSFALLTALGCFSVSCTERSGKYSGVFSPLPLVIPGSKILEMIEFYGNSYSQRREMEKEARVNFDTGDLNFTTWYLEINCFNK